MELHWHRIVLVGMAGVVRLSQVVSAEEPLACHLGQQSTFSQGLDG